MAAADSLLSWDTVRPADMVEVNPNDAAELLVATYLLVEEDGEPQRRYGTVHRMRVADDAADGAVAMTLEEGVETTGVFDMKWRPRGGDGGDAGTWGIAGADGSAHIFTGNTCVSSIALEDASQCCLSIGWKPDGGSITYASQSGEVSLADAATGDREASWQAHDHEVWVTTWLDDHVFGTGSDDCSLRLWDTRVGFDISIAKRRFDAGVTAITPYKNGTVLVGSYDECLYTFNTARLKTPLVASSQLGGGVWRVKPSQANPDQILVAAMHGGGYVVDASTHEPVTHFTHHKSMVYGCEWVSPRTVATCSFYDKILHFWRTE